MEECEPKMNTFTMLAAANGSSSLMLTSFSPEVKSYTDQAVRSSSLILPSRRRRPM